MTSNYKEKHICRLIALTLAIMFLTPAAGVQSAGGYPGNTAVNRGGLGRGASFDAPAPKQVSAIRFVDAQTNFQGGIALDAAGKVWSWGSNAYGQLGFASVTTAFAGGMKRIPFFVANNINIIQITGGYHTNFALADDGVLYGWGRGLEGQMGNGTSASTNLTPVIVSTLPNGINIKKVAAGSGISSCVYALTDDGRVFAWGFADGYRIPGMTGYVRVAVELTALFDAALTAPARIVDIELGNQHAIALDSTGLIYTWGSNIFGQLGYGTSPTGDPGDFTPGFEVNPALVDYFPANGIEIKSVSANFNTSMALDTDGNAWQWGEIHRSTVNGYNRVYNAPGGYSYSYQSSAGAGGGATANVTPIMVEFDLASASDIAPYADKPEVVSVIAGRYVSYVIDIHGRVWYWGYNSFYSMGTDGPISGSAAGKQNTYVNKASLLKTLGDGDTEENEYNTATKAPVFSGVPAAYRSYIIAFFNQYSQYGQWSPFNGGARPTVYDKKYMVTSDPDSPSLTYDYPLDSQGRRLVYIVRREVDGTYSGNFYVAMAGYADPWILDLGTGAGTPLPAGVSSETGVPALKDSEKPWIGLSVDLDTFDYTGAQLNPLPYMTRINTYQSVTLYIDKSGNLYKSSMDASGTLAWGWDYSKYEELTVGNNIDEGLYNFYCYEVIYMRGAPSVPGVQIRLSGTSRKNYLINDSAGDPPVETIKINASVASGVSSAQLNLDVEPELLDLRYVFIPYDPLDADFSRRDFTRGEFDAAYYSGAYQADSLLDGSTIYKNGDFEFSVEVNTNGILWVQGSDLVYTLAQDHKALYLVDSFYTPVKVAHRGLGFKGGASELIYGPSYDNVKKISVDPDDPLVYPARPDNEAVYGIPLDANGDVIPFPYWGFDRVEISRYDTLPGDLGSLWLWRAPQDESVELTLDDIELFYDSGRDLVTYARDFYYDSMGYSDLIAGKSVSDANGDGLASPGERLFYTLTISNEGTLAANGVSVADPLSDLLRPGDELVEDPLANELIIKRDWALDTSLNLTVADLIAGISIDVDAGETVTIDFFVTVKPDLDAGAVGALENVAYVDGEAVQETIDTCSLVLSKERLAEYYRAGEPFGYKVSWTLPADASLISHLKLDDNYPAGQLANGKVESIRIDGMPLEETTDYAVTDDKAGLLAIELTGGGLAKLADRAEVVVEYAFDVLMAARGSGAIINQVRLYYNLERVGLGKEEALEEERIIGPISLTKTASVNTYMARSEGQTVGYSIGFTLPDDLFDYDYFRIVDTIPEGLSYAGAFELMVDDVNDAAAVVDDSIPGELSAVITAGSLMGGESVRLLLTFDINADASGAIANRAELYSVMTGGAEELADVAGAVITPVSQAVMPIDPAPTSATLRACVTISGGGARLTAGQFDFALYEGSVLVATATNDAAGSIVFPAIDFEYEGTYRYTVKVVSVDTYEWTIDKNEYALTVTVYDQGGALSASVAYPGGSCPVFNNHFMSETVDLLVSKVLIDRDGHMTDDGEIFRVVLFEKTGSWWDFAGRYEIPANRAAVRIPGLKAGGTYQLVEEQGSWYETTGFVVKFNNEVVGASAGAAVAVSIPERPRDVVIGITINNEKTSDEKGLSPGVVPGVLPLANPLLNPPLIDMLNTVLPLGRFMMDHYAYIVGYPGGQVRPERDITRAEVAAVFYRLLIDETRGGFNRVRDSFTDVSADDWYGLAVSAMSATNIVRGYPDGSFKPDEPITRAELAAIAARIARASSMAAGTGGSFSDIGGHWAGEDIRLVAEYGWFGGYPDGAFRPDRFVTRAEFIVMANRMLGRVPEAIEDLLFDEMIHWADNADPDEWYYIAVQEATNSHAHEFKAGRAVPGLSVEYERWVRMMS